MQVVVHLLFEASQTEAVYMVSGRKERKNKSMESNIGGGKWGIEGRFG